MTDATKWRSARDEAQSLSSLLRKAGKQSKSGQVKINASQITVFLDFMVEAIDEMLAPDVRPEIKAIRTYLTAANNGSIDFSEDNEDGTIYIEGKVDPKILYDLAVGDR